MSEETAPDDGGQEENPRENMSVEERLSLLESENEGLKRVGMLLLALCLLVGGLLIYTQYQNRTTVYSENLILGSSKMARSALTPAPNGHIAMLFYDAMGILPTDPQFDAVPNLDGLVLYDRLGRPRIVIGTNEEDEAVIDILNTQGKVVFTAGHGTNPGSSAANSAAKSSKSTTDIEHSKKAAAPAPAGEASSTPVSH